MSITTETATVYRGGGRRWFTKIAAINGEARAMHRMRFHSLCDCDRGDPSIGMGPQTCEYHDPEFFVRWTRRVARLIRASTKESQNG